VYKLDDLPNQPGPSQQAKIKYEEPEYLVKPTWRLAWGLFWRMILFYLAMLGPIYLVVTLIALAAS